MLVHWGALPKIVKIVNSHSVLIEREAGINGAIVRRKGENNEKQMDRNFNINNFV